MSDDGQSKKSSIGKVAAAIAALMIVLTLLVTVVWPKYREVRSIVRHMSANSPDRLAATNLRTLYQTAEEVFVEQGISSVASASLIGTNSSQYLKTFASVANESYTAVILQGHAVTASGISGARTVTYGP
jgi:adenylyl- and sulfurtransferase ThiI